VAEEPAGRGWSKIGPGDGAKLRRNEGRGGDTVDEGNHNIRIIYFFTHLFWNG